MRIALVPMSAKPYHAGHHWLVKKASKDNDIVKLFVSLSDRKRKGQQPLLGTDMQKIWVEELEAIMPPNVTIEYGGSPVRKVYTEIGEANENQSEAEYFIYSDSVDTLANYPLKNRTKYMGNLYLKNKVKFPAEENPNEFTRGSGAPDVSGTAMRAAIASGNKEQFVKGLPLDLGEKSKESIWNTLNKQNISEKLIRKYIREIILNS